MTEPYQIHNTGQEPCQVGYVDAEGQLQTVATVAPGAVATIDVGAPAEDDAVLALNTTISVSIRTHRKWGRARIEAHHMGDTEWLLYDRQTGQTFGALLDLEAAFAAVYNHAAAEART